MKNIKNYLTHLKISMLILVIVALSLNSSFQATAIQTREIRVVNTDAVAGQNVNVSVQRVSLGDERSVSFSLNFDPSILSNPVVTAGPGSSGATLNINGSQSGAGQLGITLTYPSGQTFTAGTQELISIAFNVAANAPIGPTPITFGDTPVARGVTDANGSQLMAIFTPGTVNIVQQNTTPILISLNPSSAQAGGAGFTLTVIGANFVNGSVVRWNNSPRPTTFGSSSRLEASIPPSDIATAGTANVSVTNPAGGISNILIFTISNSAPSIVSISPNLARVGGAAFTLTVTGTAFVNSSTVKWNDSDRPTTFISPTQLRATISATDITMAGTANVKVFTPAPGGGTTNALPFTIANLITNVSAASFIGPEIAAESIVAGFGSKLATQVLNASSLPLPTNLANTKLMVKDSLGMERLAPQFYVSPGQVNYQMPQGTALGEASVTVTSGDNIISLGTVQVSRIVPGVFSANFNGQGVAAAVILRVRLDGSQVFEPVSRFDSATNRMVSTPIDLGLETDQVFLILFGTGFRFNSALSNVSARIGGTNSDVLYAGPAPGFVGLDQCNVRIRRSLAGRAELDVVLTVEGKAANTVRVNIK